VGVYKEIMKCNDLLAKDPWPRISKGVKDLIKKMLMFNVYQYFKCIGGFEASLDFRNVK